jgi:hypothetical protein
MTAISISAKPSNLDAYFIWLSKAEPGAQGIAIPMVNHEASVILESGHYFIYWELYGSPGGSLACEVTLPNGDVAVSVKKIKIKSGKSYYAVVRDFTV